MAPTKQTQSLPAFSTLELPLAAGLSFRSALRLSRRALLGHRTILFGRLLSVAKSGLCKERSAVFAAEMIDIGGARVLLYLIFCVAKNFRPL